MEDCKSRFEEFEQKPTWESWTNAVVTEFVCQTGRTLIYTPTVNQYLNSMFEAAKDIATAAKGLIDAYSEAGNGKGNK